MVQEQVILVNENDQEIGVMEKMQAHETGALHRAFSVYVFNEKNEFLLHQRAEEKYHSPGLWTNTCCSHPRPGKEIQDEALRRLKEEMGISCTLKKAFDFIYKADVGNGLVEHEFDHVFFGYDVAQPVPDPSEVLNWKWISAIDLQREMNDKPANFTAWFKIATPLVLDVMKDPVNLPE